MIFPRNFNHPALAGWLRLKAISLVILLGLMSGASALTCTPTSASGNYGTIDVLPGTPVAAASSFTVTCTAGTAGQIIRLCINISYGNNYGGSTTARILSGANNGLTHELYQDAAHSIIFGSPLNPYFQTYQGNSIQYDLTLGTGGQATTTPINVYGLVLGSQQTAAPGAYTWNTSTPGIQYAVKTATACPTGTGNSVAGTGATVWTATIASKCNLSATNIDFGSSTALAANIDSTGTLNVQCTKGTTYSIGLDGGLSGATNPALRKMTLGANIITYGIYTDLARTTAWGTSATGAVVTGTGTGLTQSVTMYGRVAPQTPTPPPGNYSDTIVATITY